MILRTIAGTTLRVRLEGRELPDFYRVVTTFCPASDEQVKMREKIIRYMDKLMATIEADKEKQRLASNGAAGDDEL